MANIVNYTINDVLKPEDLELTVKRIIKHKGIDTRTWRLLETQMLPASNGLSGFLGDHMKMALTLQLDSVTVEVNLFVKCMPLVNNTKAKFIDECNYYRREMIMFQLFEEVGGDEGANPWRPKAYLCNERLLVMPDLTFDGYITKDKTIPLDLHHVLLVTASIANFHAAFTNYDTNKMSSGHESLFYETHKKLFKEPGFYDSEWIRAGAKLVVEFLQEFSVKFQDIDVEVLTKAFVNACDDLKENDDTLNVILHRDLWSNNIMFRYKDNIADNAVILDYQCVRFGPPSFDLMGFLYLNTSPEIREQNEMLILKQYFDVFTSKLSVGSKSRLLKYCYDLNDFIKWCERSRGFGVLIAAMIFPYVLMDGVEAARVFDDPATFERVNMVSRTEPVVEHARKNQVFRKRLLETFEETVVQLLSTNKIE